MNSKDEIIFNSTIKNIECFNLIITRTACKFAMVGFRMFFLMNADAILKETVLDKNYSLTVTILSQQTAKYFPETYCQNL